MVRPYLEAAESGQQWLGRVPVHWAISPLGSHFDERSETVSDQDFPPLSVTKDGVVPQMANVAKTDNGGSRKLVRAGDFAINSRSDRKGSAGLSELDGSTSIVYTVLTPRPSIVGRFAHHLLRSQAFQEEYYRWGNGIVADLWSTRYSSMKRIPLAVPPLEEQRAIADYLDRETARIDTLIEEQQRLIEMLRERRRAVALHAIGEQAARGVAIDKLGRSARIGNGSTPRRETAEYWSDEGFPWLNSSVVNKSRVTHAEQFVTANALRECHLPVVAPGSILVGLTGQGKTRGMATILDVEATVNQHVAYVTPDRSKWLPEYLLWSLKASYDDLRRLSEENGSTKGGLTCEALKQFRLAAPSLDDQRRVALYLDEQTAKTDTLIAETERFIELSNERRAALITAAVTGQFAVHEVA